MATPTFWEGFDSVAEIDQLAGAGLNDPDRLWRKALQTAHFSITASGRNGQGLLKTATGASALYRPQTGDDIYVGVAFFTSHIAERHIVSWGSTNSAHVTVGVDSSNQIRGRRRHTTAGTGTMTPTSGVNIPINTWVYVEVRFQYIGTTVTITVRLNGSEVMSASEVLGTTTWNQVEVGSSVFSTSSSGVTTKWDDFYIATGGFLGDVSVHPLRPDGNGTYSEWTGSDGDQVDNYLHVDELSTDDTDFVNGTADDQRDTYSFPASGLVNREILGVDIRARATAGDTGKSIAYISKVGVDEATTADRTLTDGLLDYFEPLLTAPSGAPWEIADIDAMELGVKQRP